MTKITISDIDEAAVLGHAIEHTESVLGDMVKMFDRPAPTLEALMRRASRVAERLFEKQGGFNHLVLFQRANSQGLCTVALPPEHVVADFMRRNSQYAESDAVKILQAGFLR